MRVHVASTSRSAKWTPFDVDWTTFVEEKLKNPTVTRELFATYKSLDKDEKQIYKDCGGYIFGVLDKNSRSKKNVISRNAVLLDLDFAQMNVWHELTNKFNFEMVLHSTHSHSSETPRFRLIIPLNRDCTPDEYECVARTVAFNLNMVYFDKTTFQRNRLMYFPSHSIDGEWVFEWQRGDFLDVDLWLSVYTDWRDMASWAYHPDERSVHDGTGKTRQDPTTLGGIIGAFNIAYPLEAAIEVFLNEKYRKEESGRYTYLGGTSTSGAVVYEDNWIYSHHSTDPAQGQLMSGFELCMCHLHEDNLKKAVAWASNLPEVKRITILGGFNVEDSSDGRNGNDNVEWLGLLDLDSNGKIQPTDNNLKLIFDNDTNIEGLYRYNEFAQNIYLTRNPVWRNDVGDGDCIRNKDYPTLRRYLGLKYGLTNRAMIEEHMFATAVDHSYHPIREYISSLEWDGINRLDTALIDYFGVEDNTYTREVLKRMLIGAVMRVFFPGCKHDNTLVLVGPEGSMKSMFIHRLGKNWFSDTFRLSKDNKDYEQLKGKWIIEIGEIDKLSRLEVGEVKAFIVKTEDSYRPAYGHVVEDFPRQCIFIGTTNEDAFLKSENGNRRFYPVTVTNGMYERGLHKSVKHVWNDLTEYEVDQMWAEAFNLMLIGEGNTLSKESISIIDTKIDDYEEQNVYTGELEIKLKVKVPSNYDNLSGGR